MGAVWRLPATPCLGVIVKKSVCPLFPVFSPLRQGKRRTRREGEARFMYTGSCMHELGEQLRIHMLSSERRTWL
jgi:hypothetical protein